MNRKTIIALLLPFALVACTYLWKIPFTNNYDESITVIWLQAVGYGESTVESDSLKPGQTKEIDTSIWRTHTRSNFQFQMFHVINAKRDTLETVFLNGGLIAWLGYNVELPLQSVPDQPDDRYKSFLKYCNEDPLSLSAVELFVDYINEDYDKVIKRSKQLLNEYTVPSEEAREEFENLAKSVDFANLQSILLLQILSSEKLDSENISVSVNTLKQVFPEAFEHYSDRYPFNRIFQYASHH